MKACTTKPKSAARGGRVLPDASLRDAPEAVSRVWSYRERIEREAADLFGRLASQLRSIGANETVVCLARQAAADETRHAVLCRAILDASGRNPAPEAPRFGLGLGPTHLPVRGQALYACVALSCVTETLSTALLLEMQRAAGSALIRQTVHSILEDEIAHSRIGWAHLAAEAERSDVSWLSAFIPGMIREAIASDAEPMIAPSSGGEDLSAWGILPRERARAIMADTVRTVIAPGLEVYGINPLELQGSPKQ